MTLACFIFALAWEGFMIPNDMSSGGLMGLCTVVQYLTLGKLEASFMYIALNVILLLFAFVIIGRNFGARTIYCIAMTSLLMSLISDWGALHSVSGEILYVPEKILIPIIAGLCEGLAIGLIFMMDGSTGGTDIIALFVSKHWPISTGRFFLITDAIIITSIIFLPGRSLGDMVYGYLMMVCSSFMVDFIMLGTKQNVQILVFSDMYGKIADHIINDLDRGVTVLRAQGWYTKDEKNVLLILIKKKQLSVVTKLIKSVDPNAFVSVSQASGVYGEGFEEMKTGFSVKHESNE